ncbi:hypothetical protein AMTR_s00085p00094420 [Amborella trichopoda]|uniref:Uncharacterized protein n=1 Tax=Amborella trichopoda TaxID=13333 RepID=W1P6U3_AMBTC|nr:hypothetical protein AMTR_s00085p00094420 [Amborella trichopoda]
MGRWSQNHEGGPLRENGEKVVRDRWTIPEKGVAQEEEALQKGFSSCFRCRGDHQVRDYPQK